MQIYDYNFANPEFFYLLVLIPLLVIWYIFSRKRIHPSLSLSTAGNLFQFKKTFRQKLRHVPFILRMLSLVLLIIALARPQTHSSRKTVETEGIDIVMAVDISSSMLAEDFKPNRITAAKTQAIKFIQERPGDRIGLVVFASESFTQVPITIDHDVLTSLVTEVKSGMLADGTAIGDGLATSVQRLKDSKAKSKVIILLTDGVNNAGFIAPEDAAEIAKTFGIRVYTIGVGTKGTAPYPVETPFGTRYQNMEVKIDEEILQKIAETTGGEYFRATNNKALEQIYDKIDKMEKTKIDEFYYSKYTEEFLPFAIAAGIIFILELLLRFTYLRVLP